ncbi:LysR family transcriptional regulator [Janibacter hoylei PVAS-1]|uniref:LysR family transcriptional regulator n=2 Tax=Janibacter hoylei PVAS-1 TaxID=1210046 RepID=K1E3K7_9MICO|nr:LysR family transcriptional regulator [Janibacter hoylei]EKA61606.1 LysR family transcriptional regulator [Janibacter hoylei PVAS-1]
MIVHPACTITRLPPQQRAAAYCGRMELSLRRLQMLRELHRRGTVTAAAQALHYSPSGVSQQLAQLEREVGVKLIERHGRRVQLTELGLLLSDHAEEILGSVERATAAIEQAQSGITARLSVGVWASVASGLLPRALSSLAVEHPGIRVHTSELAPEETADAVRDGLLDLSFVIDYSGHPLDRDPALQWSVVAVERLHAAAPEGALPGESVSLTALADFPWILAGPRSHFGRAVRVECHAHGFDPRIVHTVEEQFTALAMIASGLGVTLVSDLGLTLLPPGVDVIPLDEPILRTVSIAQRASSTPRPSIDLFVEAVRSAAAEQGLTGVG